MARESSSLACPGPHGARRGTRCAGNTGSARILRPRDRVGRPVRPPRSSRAVLARVRGTSMVIHITAASLVLRRPALAVCGDPRRALARRNWLAARRSSRHAPLFVAPRSRARAPYGDASVIPRDPTGVPHVGPVVRSRRVPVRIAALLAFRALIWSSRGLSPALAASFACAARRRIAAPGGSSGRSNGDRHVAGSH